mgnify:CR=1 FL=1
MDIRLLAHHLTSYWLLLTTSTHMDLKSFFGHLQAGATTPRKSVADRYFDLYQENKVNGLHLIAFWYGDQPADIGTNIFMCSTTNNEHLELTGLEMAKYEEVLQERIDACTLG